MSLQPKGSLLTFTTSAVTATCIIEGDVTKQVRTIPFERKEKSNTYLLNLPESDGGEPILVKNVVGQFIQFSFNCGSATSVRDVTPDDNNVDNILQKMIIRTYSIKGGPSSPSSIESIYNISVDHAERLASFEGYQNLFNLRLSWQFVKALQSSNFSYLTNTGLSVSGAALNESNCIIRSFNVGVTHEDPRQRIIVAKDWSIVLDVITIENMRTYTG